MCIFAPVPRPLFRALSFSFSLLIVFSTFLSVSLFLLSASFSRTLWISNSVRPLCRPPRQQPTFECFHPLMRCHLFPSPFDLVYTYRHTAIYGTVSLASRTFIYGATRYVSELILWFIPQSIARVRYIIRRVKANFVDLVSITFRFDVACDQTITRYNFSRLLYGASLLHSHVLSPSTLA